MVSSELFTVTVAVFNIRATPPMLRSSVRHDICCAKRTHVSAIAWCELAKLRSYRELLRAIFPHRHGFKHAFMDRRNAITVDTKDLEIVARIPHKLTSGALWIPQPSRYGNQLILRDRLSDEKFDLYNFQLTNGGYNGRWRPKRNRDARKRLWDLQFAKGKKLISRTVDLKGRVAIIEGDMNRRDMPKFHPRQVVVLHNEVMYIIAVPPDGYKIEVVDTKVIPVNELKTDHPGLIAKIKVKQIHD